MGHISLAVGLSSVERIGLYRNSKGLDLDGVLAETGADMAVNGPMWNPDGRVCGHVKADGAVWGSEPWGCWGYAWNTGPDIRMVALPAPEYRNYLSGIEMLSPMVGPEDRMVYDREKLGGARGRNAMGLDGRHLVLDLCGDAGGITPEEHRERLFRAGCETAIGNDGGQSVNGYLGEGRVIRSPDRPVVRYYILIYLRRGAPAEPSDSGSDGERTNNGASESSPPGGGEGYGVCEDEKEDKPMDGKRMVCLDPGHGPGCVNGSPDGAYKEFEFAWDMYGRVKALLEANGVAVVGTKDERGYPSLTERAGVSNKAKADLFVSLHSNASGQGWTDPSGLVIYTSDTGDTAGRNKAARAILARMRTASVDIFGAGLQHSGYTVLTATTAPAMIVEYGFHTNRGDVEMLKDSAHRDKLARATAAGICDYLGLEYKEDGGASGMPRPTDAADWAAESWKKAKDKGVLDGTRPTEAVTRQELAVALDRLKLI